MSKPNNEGEEQGTVSTTFYASVTGAYNHTYEKQVNPNMLLLEHKNNINRKRLVNLELLNTYEMITAFNGITHEYRTKRTYSTEN